MIKTMGNSRLLASLVLAWCVLVAGCDSGQSRQAEDEQLNNLRRERDEFRALRDRAREELKRSDDAWAAKHAAALNDSKAEIDLLGRHIDAIREAVNAAMAEDGRLARLSSAERLRVGELVNELVTRFHALREQNRLLQDRCQLLAKDLETLTDNFRKLSQQPEPQASQPDRFQLLPK